jgi:acetyl esterase/lipase
MAGLFDRASPALTVIRPARPNGAAMLIAPGGGYRRLNSRTSAMPAAAWLAARGVTAYVLRYRLPADGWAAVAPLQDAQRAMRLIHGQPGIDPTRIGTLGFSAGGHLTALAAARAKEAFYAPIDAVDSAPTRPAVVGLVYPVISLLPPNDHTSTRKQLAGDDTTAAEAYSVERHVTPEMPPVFLAHAKDDPIALVDNARLMQAACIRAHVTMELHVFRAGGHGWGMGNGETGQWPDLFAKWLAPYGF